MLDRAVWEQMPMLLDGVVRAVAAPYGVDVEIEHVRGVPPVVNDPGAVAGLAASAGRISPDAVCGTEQSLGGEDFGWFLEKVPGALARLGVGSPGRERVDLHQPTFDVDESAIGVGVRLLAEAALLP
jgi:amidohydrolase